MAGDGLSDWLHGLPHYNFKFQSVSSTFDVRNTDYQEALAQMALPLAVVALLLVLVKLCVVCCRAKRDRWATHYRPTKALCGRWVIYISLLLVVGCAVLCALGTVQMGTAVNDFTDRTTSTMSLLDSLASLLNTTANATVYEAEMVKKLIVPVEEEGDKQQLMLALRNIAVQLEQADNSVSGALRLDKWNDDIHHYDHLRYIIALVLSCLLGAFCVLMMVSVMCRSQCLTSCFAFLVVGAMLACWLVGPVLFSASVAVSDFCADPNTAVSQAIDDQDAAYYINCGDFPYQQYFDDADQYLSQARQSAQRITSSVNLTGLVDNLQSQVDTLHARLLCSGGLHQQYTGAVDAICDEGLKSLFKSTVGLLVAGLCFAIIMFSTAKVIDSFNEDENYHLSPMAGSRSERAPLLSSSSWPGKGYSTAV